METGLSHLWKRPVFLSVSRLMMWCSGAVASGGRTGLVMDDVVVDPFGDQPPCLVQRCLGMMNAIQRCAGMKGGHIGCPHLTQFLVRGNDGPFAVANDMACFRTHDKTPPENENYY
ncbi:hypothetical protein KMAL_00420 [Novacetimonas maltaceti]|uniref:Uncharacterized protein n=1 Tax=Novacetimonas maltaceti TaxID=1203393 RepID=A0A2S3W5K5_9PROT|nr:hypothetical protein KMAL_00420 [Novacetimonas maltaceti]